MTTVTIKITRLDDGFDVVVEGNGRAAKGSEIEIAREITELVNRYLCIKHGGSLKSPLVDTQVRHSCHEGN